MKLRPDEVELTGAWISDGSTVAADETCRRIQHLIDNVLVKVAESPRSGAWEVLYEDPDDGRLWERTFPSGGMHGGGPPRLALIHRNEAAAKYGLEGLRG